LQGRMAEQLLQTRGVCQFGFFLPPWSPRDKHESRTQMSAALTREQLNRALEAFTTVGKELGVIFLKALVKKEAAPGHLVWTMYRSPRVGPNDVADRDPPRRRSAEPTCTFTSGTAWAPKGPSPVPIGRRPTNIAAASLRWAPRFAAWRSAIRVVWRRAHHVRLPAVTAVPAAAICARNTVGVGVNRPGAVRLSTWRYLGSILSSCRTPSSDDVASILDPFGKRDATQRWPFNMVGEDVSHQPAPAPSESWRSPSPVSSVAPAT